jgi:hypothetical protein
VLDMEISLRSAASRPTAIDPIERRADVRQAD